MRVKRMMERLNTDDRDFVENEIRMSEEAHGAITRRHFGVNWQDSENYDLVLNTERLTIDECVDEVMSLLDDATFEETAESRACSAISRWPAHVRAALRQDERTNRFQISIKAEDGVVTLAGLIDMGQEPMHGIEVASKVPGVKERREPGPHGDTGGEAHRRGMKRAPRGALVDSDHREACRSNRRMNRMYKMAHALDPVHRHPVRSRYS